MASISGSQAHPMFGMGDPLEGILTFCGSEELEATDSVSTTFRAATLGRMNTILGELRGHLKIGFCARHINQQNNPKLQLNELLNVLYEAYRFEDRLKDQMGAGVDSSPIHFDRLSFRDVQQFKQLARKIGWRSLCFVKSAHFENSLTRNIPLERMSQDDRVVVAIDAIQRGLEDRVARLIPVIERERAQALLRAAILCRSIPMAQLILSRRNLDVSQALVIASRMNLSEFVDIILRSGRPYASDFCPLAGLDVEGNRSRGIQQAILSSIQYLSPDSLAYILQQTNPSREILEHALDYARLMDFYQRVERSLPGRSITELLGPGTEEHIHVPDRFKRRLDQVTLGSLVGDRSGMIEQLQAKLCRNSVEN